MKYPRRTLFGLSAGLFATASTAAWVGGFRFGRTGRPRFDCSPSEPAPRDAGLPSFFCAGDVGQESPARERVLAKMREACALVAPDLIASLGDNVYPHGVTSVDDPAWETHFVQALGSMGVPVYGCLGNHDHQGSVQAQIDYSEENPLWILPAPYHSFTKPLPGSGSIEFFVLDTQPLRKGLGGLLGAEPQVRWLERAMRESKATWKIALGHHPLDSGGPKGGSSKVARQLESVFIEHGLDLYVSGHNHTLEVLDSKSGYLQVVSGASAAPDSFETGPQTELSMPGSGFTSISVSATSAWIEFWSGEEHANRCIRLDRLPALA